MYGIKNCNTIKKAQNWLQSNDIEFEFHDYRKQGITVEWLKEVMNSVDWQLLLNKRGTTFRQLDEQVKANISSENVAELLAEYPAMIKRPLLSHNGNWYVGFKDADYNNIFN
jgi:Spx/MgsR family transcriptional regulator